MSRRSCKCIDCVEWRDGTESIGVPDKTRLSDTELSKVLNYVIKDEHRYKFKNKKATMLVVSYYTKSSYDYFERGSKNELEGYISSSKYGTYKNNGKIYRYRYHDGNGNQVEDMFDPVIKEIVLYNVSIHIPELDYIYIYHGIVGMAGLRKLKHNTRRLTGIIPDVIMKTSKNINEDNYFDKQQEKLNAKLGMVGKYIESWW